MGRHDVDTAQDARRRRAFARALLDDLRALERMCHEDLIERDVRRIGAEQELFLVRPDGRPAPVAMDVLDRLADERFTTELARFNMEYNLPARPFADRCLRELHRELERAVAGARAAAQQCGADVLLTGILPTLDRTDLTVENLTPLPRYHELNRVMTELGGGSFRTFIQGRDELQVIHESVMLEACNTSFQVHFQVGAGEFARLYNLAQLMTAPLLAAAVNSPVLLQRRLWHETRIAVFEQSLDFRSDLQRQRNAPRRVSFGTRWVDASVAELFREDIARFRVLLAADVGPPSTAQLADGTTPPLTALCLHNGTVYRWNRPCFGVVDGRPHLRIENRALPAGPTVTDEVANAAFYFGLMAGGADRYADVRERFLFDDVRANFLAAARYGLRAVFRWEGGREVHAARLILEELLPLAREGLLSHGIAAEDAALYLGIIAARVEQARTGARWMLDALHRLEALRPRARFEALTRLLTERTREGTPVHTWPLPDAPTAGRWRDQYRRVAQVMTTDLFTVHPEDLIDVAASVMQWEHLRHVPVEDEDGRLVGLVSYRALLRMVAEGGTPETEPIAVREIMKRDPVTVTPATSCLEAIDLMRTRQVACLPVVQDGRLVGIVSERDFLLAAADLFERELRGG